MDYLRISGRSKQLSTCSNPIISEQYRQC